MTSSPFLGVQRLRVDAISASASARASSVCGRAGGEVGGGAVALPPQRALGLTIHVHEQGRDVTVLGRLL